jgi:hypothetical protein
MVRKYIVVFFISLIIIFNFIAPVYASEALDMVDALKGKSQSEVINLTGADSFLSKAGVIVAVIRNIGIVISIICISIIGIKYMIGSVEEKAQYKKTLFPFLFGLVFFTGIVTIVSLIIKFSQNAI